MQRDETGIYVHEQLQLGLRFCFLSNDSGVLRIANRILETRLYLPKLFVKKIGI